MEVHEYTAKYVDEEQAVNIKEAVDTLDEKV